MMAISSPAFQNNGTIPSRYTCDGENINPPLEISGVSERAKSLVLIMDDPDAPNGDWVHWIVWNIPVATKVIPEGRIPEEASEGMTSFRNSGYGGPCPPSGTHGYFFKLYALGTDLYLDPTADKKEILGAMEGMILEKAELVGLYARK